MARCQSASSASISISLKGLSAISSTLRKRLSNRRVGFAQGGFGVDSEVAGEIDDAEQQVAELGLALGVAVAAASISASSSSILARGPPASGQSKPIAGGAALELLGALQRRQREGDVGEGALVLVPSAFGGLERLPAGALRASPKMCGWRRIILAQIAAMTSSMAKAPISSAMRAW